MAYAAAGITPWHSDGLGSPSVYPESAFYRVPAGGLCFMFGPHWGLILFIGSLIVISAIAIEHAIRALGNALGIKISRAWSSVGAAVYVGSPVLLNELQAGHLKFVESFAILPIICSLSLGRWTYTRAIIIGGLIGICAVQPQFLGLAVLSAIAFTMAGRSFSFIYAITAVCIAILLNAPLLTPLLAHHGTSELSSYRPLLRFEVVESASFPDAIRALGYMAGYDSRLVPYVIAIIYWIFPILAAAATTLYFRRLSPIFALTVLGILSCSAWKTVFAPLWTFLFSHFAVLAIYRELYDFSALIWLGYCVLIPVALQRLASLVPKAAGGAALLLVASSCVLAFQSMQGIPVYSPSPSDLSVLHKIEAAHGTFRFLPIPSIAPAGLANLHGRAGYSPWFLSLANHPTAFAAIPNYLSLFIGHSAMTGSLPLHLLEDTNVGAVITSAGWSFNPKGTVEPQIAARLTGRLSTFISHETNALRLQTSGIAVLPYRIAPGSLAHLDHDGSNISLIKNGKTVSENHFTGSTDPTKSWAWTADAPYLPSWTYALPLDYFTTRTRLGLPVSAAIIVAGDAKGNLFISGCSRAERIDDHFDVFRCDPKQAQILRGSPPIVISQVLSSGTVLMAKPASGSKGTVKITQTLPWRESLWIKATAGSVLVLRQSYDHGWKISVPGASHVKIDGYANGWVLQNRYTGFVSVFYRPATLYFFALSISSIAFVLFLLTSIRYFQEVRR